MTKKTFITALLFGAILWLTGLIRFAWQMNHLPTEDSRQTDAIIVLTGGRNRIAESFRLFSEGKAKRLFISGVAKDISLQNIQNVHNLKLSDINNIYIGHNASNTIENASETREWVKKHNIKSIRLVTSNYHVARSLLEFESQNPDLEIIVHPVYSEKIEKKWWTRWRTFSLILKEYTKFLYVCIRNKL